VLVAAPAAAAAPERAPSRPPGSGSVAPPRPPGKGLPGPICLFSKHLPGLAGRELARALKDAGFEGVDLTVRAGGHVLPEKVATDLPRFAEAIRGEGVALPHITTGLATGEDPHAEAVLATAGRLRIPLFRAAHIDYRGTDVLAEVARIGAGLASLARLGKRHGTRMLYQNHVGNFGAPLWDLMRALEPLDVPYAGVEFDVRHAVAEGGYSAWRTALHLVAPRLGMICLKDFFWKKAENGAWRIENVPLGQGMVDLRAYFGLLAKMGYRGPISLHIEYLEGGDRPGSEARVLAAARQDLAVLRARLAEAYGV
jgi:sugar phosphate isomerase/epimerase